MCIVWSPKKKGAKSERKREVGIRVCGHKPKNAGSHQTSCKRQGTAACLKSPKGLRLCLYLDFGNGSQSSGLKTKQGWRETVLIARHKKLITGAVCKCQRRNQLVHLLSAGPSPAGESSRYPPLGTTKSWGAAGTTCLVGSAFCVSPSLLHMWVVACVNLTFYFYYYYFRIF